MEVGNREAIPCYRIRSLAQAMDRRKDIRLDQSQSPLGARLRTLCHNRRCLHPPRNDPHHAKATCCKRLVLNPIFSDGLSQISHFLVAVRVISSSPILAPGPLCAMSICQYAYTHAMPFAGYFKAVATRYLKTGVE